MSNYIYENIRTSSILTTSYVAGTVLNFKNISPQDKNQLIIYVAFTKGSLTTAELKVEFSHDGITYYQETFSSISSGTSTETLGEHSFSASGNYRIAVPIKDSYIKISVKGTGTVTSSSMAVDAVLGNV